jgi:hypothetical protein
MDSVISTLFELDVDIVVLLHIVEKLSGNDTVKFCSSNKKIHNLCKKYKDTIWKKKLLRDYNVAENEIIGNPMSYYLGLERNDGWYYYYITETIYNPYSGYLELRCIKNIDLVSQGKRIKEDEPHDDNFFVPGIEIPKDEEILFANFYLYSNPFGGQRVNAVGKNVGKVLKSLMKKIEHEFWDTISDDNPKLYKNILKLSPGDEINTTSVINVGYGGDIPVTFKINVFLYTVKLPLVDIPFNERPEI